MPAFLILLISLSAPSRSGPALEYSSNNDAQLTRYIEQALDRNPAVREAFARYRASLQRLPQVSALPDPMLAFTQFLRSPETRVGPQTTGVTLSQQFPWFGTLSVREAAAAKEAAMQRQQYEARKDEIVRRLKIAYYNLAYADRALEITEQERLLEEHYENLAQARYAQGVGLQQAVVKLQAELTRILSRTEELRSRRVAAEAVLNSLLNRPPASPVARIQLPLPPPVDVDYDLLFQAARRHRPELLGTLLQIERDEKRIELARKDYWPDFTLGAGMVNVKERDISPPTSLPQNGKNIFSLSLGINLPIHRRRYDAAVFEATEQKLASTLAYQDVTNTMEASVREIGFRLQTIQDQVALFQNTLLPQSEQALRSTEAAYSTGTVGVIDLLDSERVLLEVRLGLAQFIAEYMKSLAEMERAIGAPFPEVKP